MRGIKVLLGATIALIVSACGVPDTSPTATTDAPEPTVATTDAPTTTEPVVTTSTTEAGVDLVAEGKTLAARMGCAACHSPDGTPLAGPTWQGLSGKTETLDDGSTVLVDDAYLTESIIDPDAKVVDGYVSGIMPKDFSDKLSDDDIKSIIAYINSLQ